MKFPAGTRVRDVFGDQLGVVIQSEGPTKSFVLWNGVQSPCTVPDHLLEEVDRIPPHQYDDVVDRISCSQELYRKFAATALWEDSGLAVWNKPEFAPILEQAQKDNDKEEPLGRI